MHNDTLESKLNELQNFINYIVATNVRSLQDKIWRKKRIISVSMLVEELRREYSKVLDNLTEIYKKHPTLKCVEQDFHKNDFLWDSTFWESISMEVKNKYRAFSTSSFSHMKYFENNSAYDEKIPLFSSLVEAITLERYSRYVEEEIRDAELKRIASEARSKPKEWAMPDFMPRTKIKKEVVGEKVNSFRANFSSRQIGILTKCINEVGMFTTSVDEDIVGSFFSGKMAGTLCSSNNRKLAYFMQCLNLHGFIAKEWQATIADNRLVLGKKKGSALTRTDLSSATGQINIKMPNGWETIDKYIKQLKKD